MRIDIQARGFDLTDGLREHTERRLRFALGWAAHDVRKIVVRLSDVNGPRGGNDKRCHVQIPISARQPVLIEDTASDLYVAIDRAIDRAGQALARRLKRLHKPSHERLVAANEVSIESEVA